MCARSRCSARLALAALAVIVVELLLRALRAPAPANVMAADFGATGVITGIVLVVNFLSSLFGGKIDGNVKRALDGLRGGIVEMGKKIAELAVIVAWQFARVLDWLRKWIGRLFQELYKVLAEIVVRISRVLDRIFGPVIDFLNVVRQHLLTFYNNVLRPILDVIEMFRTFTRILSSFNIEWAKKLDAKLAELEDWLLEPFTFVMGKLNQVINALDRIINVNGLLQRLTLLRSLLRDYQYTNNLFWNTSFTKLQGSKLAAYRLLPDPTPVSEAIGHTRLYIDRRDGPDAGRMNEAVADFRIRVARYGIN